MDLSAKDGIAQLPSHIEYIIQTSYTWFSRSCSRQAKYQKKLEEFGFEAITKIVEQITEGDDAHLVNDLPEEEDKIEEDDLFFDDGFEALDYIENNEIHLVDENIVQTKKIKARKLLSIDTTRWLIWADCEKIVIDQVIYISPSVSY